MYEIDRLPFGPTRFAPDAALDRFVLSPAVDVWIYRYAGSAGRRSAGVSARLEIGAQIEGAWRQRGALGGDGLFERGQVHVLNPAEAYDLAFRDGGLVVGLTVDHERLLGASDDARELRVVERSTNELFDLCCDVFERRQASDVDASLRRWILRACDVTADDPVIRVRRELERYYQHDLYLRHLAPLAGMRPETLVRRFARRYGLTPIQYRLRLRLNAAARLGWVAPEQSVASIAEAVGIPNLSYFHRAFRRYFGTSLTKHRRVTWARQGAGGAGG